MLKTIYNYLLPAASLFLFSCNNGSKPGSTPLGSVYEPKPAVVLQTRDICFLGADGPHKQDTLKVHLAIHGTLVEGSMDYMPYEKDARLGLLSGTISDDIIKVRWTFNQEGVKDTLSLDMKLTEQALLQRPLRPNPTNGREETDPGADYGSPIPVIACP